MKDDIWTYGTAKLLLLMACKEMVQRLEGTGVTCLTAWPGIAGQHPQPLHKCLPAVCIQPLGLEQNCSRLCCQLCVSFDAGDQVSWITSMQICGACLMLRSIHTRRVPYCRHWNSWEAGLHQVPVMDHADWLQRVWAEP